jgi:hypothetical protein
MIRFDRAHELLSYDPTTGALKWRQARGPVPAGSEVKSLDSHGYIRVQIDGERYQGHLVAWLLHHGEWPIDEIDHRNGVRSDNRIDNLREATRRLNSLNQAPRIGNSSVFKGVYMQQETGKWMSRFCADGRRRYLGLFDSEIEAAKMYDAAAWLHSPDFARLNFPVEV